MSEKKKPDIQRWYKVEISHGPGHHSKTTWYRYSYREWLEDEIERDFNWPIATFTKLRKIPQDVAEVLIADLRAEIKFSNQMIKRIEDATSKAKR